jgi:hypothetical protein
MSTLVEKAEALAVEASCSGDALSVILSDGRVLSAPLVWFPRLMEATPRERADWELIGGGIGVHWEAIDEDISVASLLQPENFMRLPNTAVQPTGRARRSGGGTPGCCAGQKGHLVHEGWLKQAQAAIAPR